MLMASCSNQPFSLAPYSLLPGGCLLRAVGSRPLAYAGTASTCIEPPWAAWTVDPEPSPLAGVALMPTLPLA